MTLWLLRPFIYGAITALACVVANPSWAVDAPFGFAWGPLAQVPKPSLALKDNNVTILIYRRDRLQTTEMAETEMVLLDVCKAEGLQQISWASKALSATDAAVKFTQIVAQGVQKYGETKPTSDGALAWRDGQLEVLSVSGNDGSHRILMVSRGPNFEACAKEHDQVSDQSLRTRWLRRIELPN